MYMLRITEKESGLIAVEVRVPLNDALAFIQNFPQENYLFYLSPATSFVEDMLDLLHGGL